MHPYSDRSNDRSTPPYFPFDGQASAQADNPGSAGRTASPWPAGPMWAPPTSQLPPLGVSLSDTGARQTPPPPARRRWPSVAVAAVVAAALVGGGAGYAGATLAGDTSPRISTATAQPLAFTAQANNVSAILAKVEPSVVTVKTTIEVRGQFGSTQTGEAAGTGIILTADGEVLTNAHVVADATSITVTLYGKTSALNATLIGKDTVNDVALLKIEAVSGLTPATIADSATVMVGDDAIAIGNALNLDGGVSVTKGIISALGRSINVEAGHLSNLIQTDAAISSGNSGGPLVNNAGQVVGMNTAGATSSQHVTAENIGFSIPINQAMKVVTQLRGDA